MKGSGRSLRNMDMGKIRLEMGIHILDNILKEFLKVKVNSIGKMAHTTKVSSTMA